MYKPVHTFLIVAAVSASSLLAARRCAADWSGWQYHEPSCGRTAVSPWNAGGWEVGGWSTAGWNTAGWNTAGCSRSGCHAQRFGGRWLLAPESYAPTYRTKSVRVPVTRFEQVKLTDPMSGEESLTLEPCNTFEQQARRVPATCLQPRPVYWWPQPPRGTGCGAAAPAASAPAEPDYYAPAPLQPVTPSPVPSDAPRSGTPADRRPQLDPDQLQIVPPISVDPSTAPRLLDTSIEAPPRPDPGTEAVAWPFTSAAAGQTDRLPEAPALLDPRDIARAAPTRWTVAPVRATEASSAQPLGDHTGWQSERVW